VWHPFLVPPLLAAFFVTNTIVLLFPLHSASTELVLSLGGGTVAMGFTLDPSRRDFVLSRPALECPARGPYSSHVESAALVAPRLATLASWG